MSAAFYNTRVNISQLNSERIVSVLLISIFVLLLTISVLLYNFIGLNWINLGIHCLLICSFIAFIFSLNNISQVSILGDSVLVKKSNSKRFVTPITSIRKLRHLKFFNLYIYSLEFKVDGQKQKIRFLSGIDKISDIQRLNQLRKYKAAS